jgi:signal transduction histidine kinase
VRSQLTVLDDVDNSTVVTIPEGHFLDVSSNPNYVFDRELIPSYTVRCIPFANTEESFKTAWPSIIVATALICVLLVSFLFWLVHSYMSAMAKKNVQLQDVRLFHSIVRRLIIMIVFQSFNKLKELDRRKNEFVAFLYHELRNPLQSIQGISDFDHVNLLLIELFSFFAISLQA